MIGMESFNKDWKFHLGDVVYGHLLDLDEGEFQTVNLPHDYSIEQPYNQELGDGCTGYLLGGIGWYRKKFQVTNEVMGGKVFINFDGIYNRSNLYVNETFVQFHPYGYAPLLVDITKYLKEGENILAVKVDHTRYADSRWYTGSGIYRKVKLFMLPKTYIPVWGIKIKTEDVTKEKATICVNIDVINEVKAWNLSVTTRIYDPSGKEICQKINKIGSELSGEIQQCISISYPTLWGIYNGNMYRAKMMLMVDNKCVQEKEVKFGIRNFSFDIEEGFYLNGNHEYIKGVCLHHDAGLVGAAVPLDVWRRRLHILIECGCNAIRTAHNPASEEFLDLCDELGLLVQEEFYDEWDYPKDKRYNMQEKRVDDITRGHHEFFKDYAKQDLQDVIHRDYNHPCIIQWSIGNEIEWTYPKYVMATGYFDASASGNYFWEEPPYTVEQIRDNIKKLPRELYEIGDTAQKLAAWTKELDQTRPVVANCILPSASYESGYTDALDMVGFSYRQVVYERSHINYPDKPIMGTENLAQWHEWKQVLEKNYIAGIFLWTGIDYIGESGNVDVWPRKATASGLLNVAGFKKGSYYMFQSLWSDKPCMYMATQRLEESLYEKNELGQLVDRKGNEWNKRLWVWQNVNEHWNYTDCQEVVIEIYSNCDSVTLYLNNQIISTKQLIDFEDRIYKWCIPYQKGRLHAIGSKGDVQVNCERITAQDAVSVQLVADKTILDISTDSVVHIEATLFDSQNHRVCHQEKEITFTVEGNLRWYGVDNGSPDFVGNHHGQKIVTHNGRALLIVGGIEPGTAKITASIEGNVSNEIVVCIDNKM